MFNVGDKVVIKKYDEVNDHYGIFRLNWEIARADEHVVREVKNEDLYSYAIIDDELGLIWPIDAFELVTAAEE